MNTIELCQKCNSINTGETPPSSIATELLKMVGYYSFCCKSCGHTWSQFLPMSTLLSLIYLLLAVEISFLFVNYMH